MNKQKQKLRESCLKWDELNRTQPFATHQEEDRKRKIEDTHNATNIADSRVAQDVTEEERRQHEWTETAIDVSRVSST